MIISRLTWSSPLRGYKIGSVCVTVRLSISVCCHQSANKIVVCVFGFFSVIINYHANWSKKSTYYSPWTQWYGHYMQQSAAECDCHSTEGSDKCRPHTSGMRRVAGHRSHQSRAKSHHQPQKAQTLSYRDITKRQSWGRKNNNGPCRLTALVLQAEKNFRSPYGVIHHATPIWGIMNY